MNLHLEKTAFAVLIDEISKRNNIRRDILEKDYYVTLLLNELSKQDNQSYAYFKGGTALYKALKSIRRFSEDIDLTVFVDNCETANQEKNRLEKAVKKFSCLKKGETIENRKGSITVEYLYESMYALDIADTLQRFGRVKVEATSFTVSEPTSKIFIAPHLYEQATFEQKKVLTEQYAVKPFEIETISLERIFIDKIFAAEFYFSRGSFGDVAKHVYDLTVLLENEQIVDFLKDKQCVKKIVGFKRKEETKRKGGVPADMRIAEFLYFKRLDNDEEFLKAFEGMQKIYVFDEKDRLTKNEAIEALTFIQNFFNQNDLFDI